MNPPPPPPPPHGENPKSSGLPPGKYDIFIIPEHSAGSGFLYLPSLRTNPASFGAGFATALICVALWTVLTPVVQVWWRGVRHSGGMGMIMVMLAIAVGAWALGRMQIDGGPGPGGGGGVGGGSSGTSGSAPPPNGHATGGGPGGSSGFGGNPQPNANSYPPGGGYGGASGFGGVPPPNAHGYAGGAGAGAGNGYGSNSQHNAGGYAPGAGFGGAGGFQGAPQPNTGGYAAGPTPTPGAGSSMPGGERPKPTWQRTNPGAGSSGANTAKGTWEKAREETKKREEERKAKEAERKRKEENERKGKEAREKEAREREAREKMQKEAREKIERELREKLERETREKIERETREKLEREAREKKEKEKQNKKDNETKPKGSIYAFSAVGERTNPWPNGAPRATALRSQSPSPTKKPPPPPTVKTCLGTEDDAYSYRPYDKPKKPTHKKSHSSLYSESSYAASHTTAQTTPPPSRRGPYSTKDPDKIVIKAVYSFTNAFLKTPTSQLVSGVGSVTDGLILRITTEGLFIDDDVRGVPQREWDVKAWTLKLVEVWCPTFRQGPTGNSTSASARTSNPVRRLWNFEKDKAALNEEADALLIEMLQVCKDTCRLLPTSTSSSDGSATGSPYKSSNRYRSQQTGQLKNAHLHVLRASIRDQEGKRYVFVITEEESWKVSVGLQRLRRGTQVRQLGVSTMTSADSRTTLENLGWT
jgi:hypothetical protein